MGDKSINDISLETNYDHESQRHLLNSQWIVWYHNPSDKNWTPESYKDILEIHSVEDMLVLKNSWEQCLPLVSEGMFFMMRKLKDGRAIIPLWEDKMNINGGVWSFKLDKEEAQKVWFKLCSFAIGETICKSTKDSLEITGISISPKKNFCIIKIWNQYKEKNNINLLSSDLSKFLNINEVLYSNHDNNIERDAEKRSRFDKRWTDSDKYDKKYDKFERSFEFKGKRF
jgi:hypothetical protein